jgi:hypothetical protein
MSSNANVMKIINLLEKNAFNKYQRVYILCNTIFIKKSIKLISP